MMRLAALQMRVACGDVAANIARIERAAAEAAEAGATILVTPELALTGYGAGERIRTLAEPADGPALRRLSAIAASSGVAIIAGFAERADGGVYNSAAYVDGGERPVIYRKSHLFADYERGLFRPAEPSAVVFHHRGMRCGMLICYDVEFPENVRRLAEAGAEAVLVPTALPVGPSGRFIAEHMIRTRAFENQVAVAYVNHCGADELFSFAGLSCIAAPDGSMLAAANPTDEALLVIDFDPEAFARSKRENTYLRDLRRPGSSQGI
ncbi:carbon-nitrogen hydrolase family protein [Arvimicrobium flavum]|uniref:carbon-nitrogen hydrolase family protein n=1 Tax=Arvimicrobium flavum TaxID=3393320 RepID=UPI00237C1C10|nr:carbon-nitrogen hydrolase family protein [Mesorhizobium shangrilense]